MSSLAIIRKVARGEHMTPTYFNQYDPRWANVKIGNSNLPMGQKGCAVCGLCMAFADFGISITPLEAAKLDWYTPEGLVVWKKVEAWLKSKVPPHRDVSIYRYYGRNDKDIQAHLIPGYGVLVQVASESHWEKCDRKMWLRNDYECRDPWGGVNRSAVGNYNNITGYVIIHIGS